LLQKVADFKPLCSPLVYCNYATDLLNTQLYKAVTARNRALVIATESNGRLVW